MSEKDISCILRAVWGSHFSKTYSMRHFLTLICSLHAFRAGCSELIYNRNFPYIINPYRDLSMLGTPPTIKVTEANTDQKTWCRPNLRGCLQISSAEIRVQVLRFLSEIGRPAGLVPKPSFLEGKSLAQGEAINLFSKN